MFFHNVINIFKKIICDPGPQNKIWNLRVQKNRNIEKITFKVVRKQFLAKHITNQKLSFAIFTVENLQNIFMEHDIYIIS